MIDEQQSRINKQNKQKFMAHPFSLCNLLQGFTVPTIFNVAASQIFTSENQSQNMTFGVQKYGVKIMKSKDNTLRILYYSILCYMFELKEHFLTVAIKNTFVSFILNNLKTILPTKYDNDYYLRISKAPFLTTSQIKSSFIKFMHILQKKPKDCKMIIEELSILPQMDFIFMSIFKTLIGYKLDKNGFIVLPEDQLVGLQQKIGISLRIKNDFIIIQNQFQIRLIDKSLQIEQFIIQKYAQPKIDSVINSKFIRKDTTQSVGYIQQDEDMRSQQYTVDHPDPFNAKLVVSLSTDQIDQQIKQLAELKQYINENNIFEDQEAQKLEKKKSPYSRLNPFSKKNHNLQVKVDNFKRSSTAKKTLQLNSLNLKPRLSQFLKERISSKTSKSKNKLLPHQFESKPSNFRSFWKIKQKLKTQEPQHSKNFDYYNLKRQNTFGNDQFRLQRMHTFGNPTLKNNLSKDNILNSNTQRNIFNQICEHISSPKSQKYAVRNKRQSYTSFSSNSNFNKIQNQKPSRFNRQNGGDQNRKYSFQISLNSQIKKNYQRISNCAKAK